MELKEKIKITIDKITKQNKSDYKKIWILFALSILTACSTFLNPPIVVTSVAFVAIATLTIKMFLRIKECGRLQNKLISLMKDLEQ
jgi:uncharacterized membrane protein